jgi:hypothetical protein
MVRIVAFPASLAVLLLVGAAQGQMTARPDGRCLRDWLLFAVARLVGEPYLVFAMPLLVGVEIVRLFLRYARKTVLGDPFIGVGTGVNCIVYHNTCGTGPNHHLINGGAMRYSCTTPDPGGGGEHNRRPAVRRRGWWRPSAQRSFALH